LTVHPLNSSTPQGGFSKEKGGNLRDHDGCKANAKAISATVHYDGDYGAKGMPKGGPVKGGPKPPPPPPPGSEGNPKIAPIIGDRG